MLVGSSVLGGRAYTTALLNSQLVASSRTMLASANINN